MESSNYDKFATERIFLFFKFIYAYSTRIIFFQNVILNQILTSLFIQIEILQRFYSVYRTF